MSPSESSLVEEFPNVLISRGVSLHRSSFNQSPSLVLIFSWSDAPLAAISKFVTLYRRDLGFVHSTIVVVRSSSASFIFKSVKQREKILQPIFDLLLAELYSPECRGLIIHLISNSAGFQLVQLAKMLKHISGHPPRPVPIALILDSLPSSNEYRSMVRAFVTILPGGRSFLLKHLLWTPTLSLIYAIYYVVNYWILGNEELLSELREYLVKEPSVIPLGCGHPGRLYIYSDADMMATDKDVEAHLDELASKKFTAGDSVILVEKYKGSRHVSHLRNDHDRYRDAVSRVWEAAKRAARDGTVKL